MRAVLLFLLMLWSSGAAGAQTIRVQAGEHDGFTRLVLTLPAPSLWAVGRTDDGYELWIDRAGLRFDLSDVFRAIPRMRLSAIWADPQTGHLRLGIGCACHALPFEFRPDILVIDLRDGPPPKASSFEAALDGQAQPALTRAAELRPRSRPPRRVPIGDTALLDLAFPQGGAAPPDPALRDQPKALPPPDLAPMRADLLQALGRAATEGVIDLDAARLPPDGPEVLSLPADGSGSLAHLAINDAPGRIAAPATGLHSGLTADGQVCLPDSAFDLASWADDRPFDTQVAAARGRIVGEFDRPDPAAVADLIRLYLYFGFGAEAQDVVTAFAVDDPAVPVWRAMAQVLDQTPAMAGGPLAQQGACPGAAALWAALAAPSLRTIDAADPAAITTAFSALPVHLRRHLGPGLAQKFLTAGDLSTAQAIRNAIWRAPGDAGAAARLMDGQLDAERGNLSAAETTFAEVASNGGTEAARALVELVDARIGQGEAVDPATVTELAAFVHEHKGSPLERDLIRAELLARASQGDFEAGFGRLTDADGTALADLWGLLARSGPDSAVLAHAVLADDAPVPRLDDAVRTRIGTRLLDLGFADAALRWLPAVTAGGAGTDALMARAELARGDARAALRGLAGLGGTDADQMRAAALSQLGDLAAAAGAFAVAGDDPARQTALWRAGDWAAGAGSVAAPARGDVAWLASAKPPVPDATAPLAAGRALVADSSKARAAILALLDAQPAPNPGKP